MKPRPVGATAMYAGALGNHGVNGWAGFLYLYRLR
jgi:hypothetical protein